MLVRIARYDRDGKLIPGSEHTVEAREVARSMFVPLPTGWTKRVYKYDRRTKLPTGRSVDWSGTPGRSASLVITWDPTEYQIKGSK